MIAISHYKYFTNVVNMYTNAFLKPETLAMTIMFGRISPSPASRRATAGAALMPRVINACTNGASVRDAK